MADITEKTGNGELVTNRDQLVVVDNIESLIKIIRGQQVMLDRGLATLYGVETKRLNEQVKRNIKRFPEDFMFQLTKDECLRSQFATLNEGRRQHLKYMPYVFTENGISHRCIHKGLRQKVVWLLKNGDTYTRRIGGKNQ